MIGYLRGTVRHGTVLTDNGVGFQVTHKTGLVEGETVELHVHTAVRENAVTLYGFDEPVEKELFLALTNVGGVGPQAAMAILRDVGVNETVQAVLERKAKTLTKAAGVGPKLAERITTLANVDEAWVDDERSAGTETEITLALTSLGFDEKEAREAARMAVEDLGELADEAALVAKAFEVLRGEQSE